MGSLRTPPMCVLRRGSELLMSRTSADLVGQADSLPLAALASSQVGRLIIGSRLSACPTRSSCFHMDSKIRDSLENTLSAADVNSLRGATVLVTGATGFIGSHLVER